MVVSKKDILSIFIIFILALSLRVLYLKDYLRADIYPFLAYSDSYSYFIWAKDIASGDLLGRSAFMKWPLYAFFLGLLFKVTRENILSVYLLQFILGAINCVLVYFITKHLFKKTFIAVVAGLLSVGYGLFMFYDGLLIYTNLSLFLNSLLFLFILHIKDCLNKKNLFWLGFFLGVCTITQANIVIFGILAILWILSYQNQPIWWQKKACFRNLIYNFSYFIVGLFLVIGSITLLNFIAEKDLVPIAGHLGINFYCGNNAETDGTFYCPAYISPTQDRMFRDAKIIAKLSKGKNLRTSEVSHFWLNKSLEFIKNNPQSYFKLLFKKFTYIFSPQEFVHEMEYYYLKDKIKVFKISFLDLRFILPFTFLGMFLGVKRFKETVFLYLAIFSLAFSIILFFVATRYRIIIVPYFIIFAALGIFSIYEALRQRRFIRVGMLFTVVISFLVLFNYENLRDNLPNLHQHLYKTIDYVNKSDYPSALKEAQLASKIEPINPHTVFSLGVIYYSLNKFELAEEKFKETVNLVPFFVDAYYNLGLLYNQQERFTEAQGVLEQAIFLDPENPGAHLELGITYKAKGDMAQAREEFLLAKKFINRWRTEEINLIKKELE